MYKLLKTAQMGPFEVQVDTCPDQTPLSDRYDETCYDVANMNRKVNWGIWQWFCVRVSVHLEGVLLAQKTQSACLYPDVTDVLYDGVVDELMSEVLAQAEQIAEKLREKLPQAA